MIQNKIKGIKLSYHPPFSAILLKVLEIHQPRGFPQCEVPIRPHTVWNRSPIQDIKPIAMYSYSFSLATKLSTRELCACNIRSASEYPWWLFGCMCVNIFLLRERKVSLYERGNSIALVETHTKNIHLTSNRIVHKDAMIITTIKQKIYV